MRIQLYCKKQGMDRNAYKEYKAMLENKALELKQIAIEKHGKGTGVFFQTNELIELGSHESYYILDEMKEIGFEFIENSSFYRVA